MRRRLNTTQFSLPLLALLPICFATLLGGCVDSAPPDFGEGGSTSKGGVTAAGGTPGLGGATSNGGTVSGVGGSSGGSPSGGKSATGGAPASGGATATGGATARGGAPALGGAPGGGAPAGGTTAAGSGGSGTGGAVGSGKWPFAEDPGEDCPVGTLPAKSALTANNKLPDPFKKLDGTAMASKADWRCRRKEILEQSFAYIYGKKPKPAPADVTGTVSSTSISVSVKGPSGTGSFTASVSGVPADKPAPAIISFGGIPMGMPIPNSVARINFNATSVGAEGNGTNPGTGAFYTAYGADHEAGLLAAWAWGVSRIIDVIEKNPGTIDPKRIAVTGCSRFGKGAFVAGVLDNRMALTIPVESGVGGTPALRLIEQLDTYSGSEWPYHAISYQQWFSPEKLGQFTSANNAGGDNTNLLPVDMHQMMALIVPRGLYIVDNPSTMYNGLDRNSAYVTALVGQMVFNALGYGSNISYQGVGGGHCAWRDGYSAQLTANIQKFLLGNASATTGAFSTDLGGTKPTAASVIDWTAPTLSGSVE